MCVCVHVRVLRARMCVRHLGYRFTCVIKDEIKKKYETEQMPKYLGMLEKLLVSNKGGDGYFVGDKVISDSSFKNTKTGNSDWIDFLD